MSHDSKGWRPSLDLISRALLAAGGEDLDVDEDASQVRARIGRVVVAAGAAQSAGIHVAVVYALFELPPDAVCAWRAALSRNANVRVVPVGRGACALDARLLCGPGDHRFARGIELCVDHIVRVMP